MGIGDGGGHGAETGEAGRQQQPRVVHMESGVASRMLPAAPTLGIHGIAESAPDALSY